MGGDCEMDPELTLREHTAILKQCASVPKKPGEWVTGYGFQLDAFLEGAKCDQPLKALDELSSHNLCH